MSVAAAGGRDRRSPPLAGAGLGGRLEVDPERLWRSLTEMAAVGALPSGGCRRLALTDADKAGRDLFATWCRQAGCDVRCDRFGNIFAIRRGGDPSLPVVLIGSHLDTQPNGGRFDGILGVLAGLEVLRTCADRNLRTQRSIAVVDWSNEEGPRFKAGLTGSKGFAGMLGPDALDMLRADDGPSFAEELTRIGYAGSYRLRTDEVASYLELHIEQGPILERTGRALGVVEAVQGMRWYEVAVRGSDRHAGATPHELRADSLMTAARFAVMARDICLSLDGDMRFTIGRMCVEPGSVNTVPGATTFTIDLRHPRLDLLDAAEGALARLLAQLDREERTTSALRVTSTVDPVRFDPDLTAMLRDLAGKEAMAMTSGAVHDACALAAVVPAAMIFIPCRDGISHSHEERIEPEHAAAGCELLLRAAVRLAGGE